MKRSVLHARVEHVALVHSNVRRVVALAKLGANSGTARVRFLQHFTG